MDRVNIRRNTTLNSPRNHQEGHIECPECLGTKEVYDGNEDEIIICPNCDGQGWVFNDRTEEPEDFDDFGYGDEDYH